VNGDGLFDLIVGAPGANKGAGTAYVLYGKLNGFRNIDVGLLEPADGFTVRGVKVGDNLGMSVSGAGKLGFACYIIYK
jgi:hypothetical protein